MQSKCRCLKINNLILKILKYNIFLVYQAYLVYILLLMFIIEMIGYITVFLCGKFSFIQLYLFIILPSGVVSKNDIGTLSKRCTMREW